jgi:magnesium transporter
MIKKTDANEFEGREWADRCPWIDLIDPTDAEARLIRDRYAIELPTLSELEEIESSSRLRIRDGILYMTAPLLSGTSTRHWQIAPVGFILAQDVCITVRFTKLEAFDALHKNVDGRTDITPAEVLTRMLEEVVDRAADHLERASQTVNDTSQSIFFDLPARGRLNRDTAILREAMRSIGQASDRASRVRYSFLSVGRMASFVAERCQPRLPADIRERLDAVRHDIASLDEFEASLSGRIQLLQDAATGFISIEQNDVVKVLTVASVVGIPPVLVVGIYGMNFKYMPELSWHFGYPFAIFLCILTTVAPLLWFKWRGWL